MVRDLFRSRNTTLLKLHVELMYTTCCDSFTKNTRRQVKELVLSLFREVYESWPFWFNLIRWFSEATALIYTHVQTCVASLIGALSLLLPFLSLTSHLRSLHFVAHCALIFDTLSLKLPLMNIRSLNVLVTATVITLLVFSSLFLLDDVKPSVIINQVRLSNSASLLLCLHCCLSGRYKCRNLQCSEVAKLAESFFLEIWLEKLAIKLIFEFEA